MANEATLVFRTELPIPFTVADAATIEKGSLLKMTDPMTAIIVSGAADSFAGIAAVEKIANNGETKLGVYRRGIFKMMLSGSATVGDNLVVSSSVNFVQVGTYSGGKSVGIALETGTTGESILVEVNAR